MKEEGVIGMFKGSTMATPRAVVMAVGQLAVYDQVKLMLLYTNSFGDNMKLHFTSSILAVYIPRITITKRKINTEFS